MTKPLLEFYADVVQKIDANTIQSAEQLQNQIHNLLVSTKLI
jgi:hypothetical protein